MVKWRITINGEVIETSNLHLELSKLIHRYGVFRAKNFKYGKGGLLSYGEYYFPKVDKTAIVKMIEEPGKAVVVGKPRTVYVHPITRRVVRIERSKDKRVPVKRGFTGRVEPRPIREYKRKKAIEEIELMLSKLPKELTGGRTSSKGRLDEKRRIHPVLLAGGLLLLLKLLKR